MDLPIIQRRDYGDYDQSNDQQVKETNLNASSSENNKYAIIHFSIILSVLIFVGLVGLLLYMYRRKLQRLKSFNLNRVVNITHVKNADDGIYSSLDYYSNAYENYNISHAYPSDDKFSAYPYPSNDKFSAYPYPSDNQSSAYPSNNKFSDYPYPSNDKFSAYPSDDKSSAYPLNDKFSAYPSDDKYSAYSSDDKSSAYPSDDKSSIYSSDDKIYPQLDPVHENEDESELKPSGSPTSSISRGNRNYFIYAKSGKIKRTISTLKKDTISRNNSEIKSSNNNITNKSKLDNNITNNNETNKLNSSIKLNNGKKRTKLNINQISTPITSPSESIYNNEKADSLSRTTTRVLPPIPTFSSNKYIQPREILRGSDISENYLIRQYSDDSAATIVANTFDATITAFDDNPIIDITKESDLNNMKTTEEMDLDLMPTNRI